MREIVPVKKRHLFRFETKDQPVLSRGQFLWRLARNFAATLALIGVSLFAGMFGYRHFEGMEWIDAFVNASMILSGMGPLGELHTWGGKLFAGCYALYSGLVLIAAAGILAAPVFHRIMHKLQLDDRSK